MASSTAIYFSSLSLGRICLPDWLPSESAIWCHRVWIKARSNAISNNSALPKFLNIINQFQVHLFGLMGGAKSKVKPIQDFTMTLIKNANATCK